MKVLGSLSFAMVGAITGAAIATGFHGFEQTAVVRAQDQFTTFAGCISGVPKSWGDFMGASSYGLAFQDEKGTLRFFSSISCRPSPSKSAKAKERPSSAKSSPSAPETSVNVPFPLFAYK